MLSYYFSVESKILPVITFICKIVFSFVYTDYSYAFLKVVIISNPFTFNYGVGDLTGIIFSDWNDSVSNNHPFILPCRCNPL